MATIEELEAEYKQRKARWREALHRRQEKSRELQKQGLLDEGMNSVGLHSFWITEMNERDGAIYARREWEVALEKHYKQCVQEHLALEVHWNETKEAHRLALQRYWMSSSNIERQQLDQEIQMLFTRISLYDKEKVAAARVSEEALQAWRDAEDA